MVAGCIITLYDGRITSCHEIKNFFKFFYKKLLLHLKNEVGIYNVVNINITVSAT